MNKRQKKKMQNRHNCRTYKRGRLLILLDEAIDHCTMRDDMVLIVRTSNGCNRLKAFLSKATIPVDYGNDAIGMGYRGCPIMFVKHPGKFSPAYPETSSRFEIWKREPF